VPSPKFIKCATTPQQRWNGVMNKLIEFVRDESGATAIEYGLIAALVSVAAIGAMGNSLGNIFNEVSSKLDDSITP